MGGTCNDEPVGERALYVEIEILGSTVGAGTTPAGRLKPDGQAVGVGSGMFEIAGSALRSLKPVLAYLVWQRILFPEFARSAAFDNGSISHVYLSGFHP